MVGKTIAHYEITDKLGEGGMGVVYKARDSHLDRFVAIKVLPPERVADPERKRRFVQEAKSASALNHPNIIHVYDIDQQDGVDYIAMEYVEGKTLDELIGRKGLKLKEALKYAVQTADALAKAHAAGIIHRDIKPGNVMVTTEGRVKVLDFGLAKLTEAAPVSPDGTAQTEQPTTESGMIVGTVTYMSPEQAEGKKVDARSDIFSFGSLLYEMVTGRRAFRRDSPALTLAAILHMEPPPLGPNIPRDVEKIVERCLRKDPERRFQTMGDLKVVLEDLKEESDSGKLAAVPAAGRKLRRWPWVAGAAILVGATVFLAAGIWLSWRLTHSSTAEPAIVFTRLTSDSGLTTDPALSPDGKLLAYASDRNGKGNLDIWVQQVGGAAPLRVTEGADAREPAFSPDATRIAFRFERDGGGVYVVPALGGVPRKIAPLGRRPRFSPDGKWIAYWTGGVGGAPLTAGNSKVYIVPSEGGPLRQIASGLDAALYPVWAPDSEHLLLLGSGKGRRDWWVALVETDGQAIPAVPTGFSEFSGYQGIDGNNVPSGWMPREDSVLFSAGVGQASNLWRISISPKTWKVAGPPQRLTSGTTVDEAPAVALAAPGRTRVVFASLSKITNIWSLALDANRGGSTGLPLRLTQENASDQQPSISRDGKRLAFVSNRSGDYQVYVKDLDSAPEIPLTFGPPAKFAVSISPDGSRVVYAVNDGARMPVYIVPAEGGAAEKICSDCGYNLSWSPDGGTIFYVIPVSGRIASLDLKSRRTTAVAQHEQFRLYQPQLSPDGCWLAFEALSSANSRIYVTPFHPGEPVPESQWVSMTDNPVWDRKSRWSPDGRLLYFLSERDGFRCLWARPFDAASRSPSGPVFAVYHSHLARLSMLNLGLSALETAVVPGKFIFNMANRTGNIWMADLPH